MKSVLPTDLPNMFLANLCLQSEFENGMSSFYYTNSQKYSTHVRILESMFVVDLYCTWNMFLVGFPLTPQKKKAS